MLKSVAMGRICRLFSISMERGAPFTLSSLSKTYSTALITSLGASRSPITLQVCKRHASLVAKNLNICGCLYCPLSVISLPTKHFFFRQSKFNPVVFQRLFASQQVGGGGSRKRTGAHSSWDKANRTTVTYMTALAVAVVGLSYAAVPLYRIFCQASGYGGTVSVVDPSEKVENMEPLRERELTIR